MLVPKSDRVGTLRSSSCTGVHKLASYLDNEASLIDVGGSEKERRWEIA